MEEEKPQLPAAAAHQIDGAVVTANVADGERPGDATVFSDEAIAHAMHMADLMQMHESQLLVPAAGRRQDGLTPFSGAGGGQDRFVRHDHYVNSSGANAVGQDRSVNFSRTGGGQDLFVRQHYYYADSYGASGGRQDQFVTGGQDRFGRPDYYYANSSGAGAGGQDRSVNFSRTGGGHSGFVPRDYYYADSYGASAGRQDHFVTGGQDRFGRRDYSYANSSGAIAGGQDRFVRLDHYANSSGPSAVGQDRSVNFSSTGGGQDPFVRRDYYYANSSAGASAGGQDRFVRQDHYVYSSGASAVGQDHFVRHDHYANSSGASPVGQNRFPNFYLPGVIPAEYTFANFYGPGGRGRPVVRFPGTNGQNPIPFPGIRFQDTFSSGAGDFSGYRAHGRFGTGGQQDPFANHPRARGPRNRAGAQLATTETDFIRYDCHDGALAPSSSVQPSSRDITGDNVATPPSETLTADCVASLATHSLNAATGLARPSVPVEDVVSSKRRSLLADADAETMFAGMAEEHNNRWYESIINDAANEELVEQMDELDLREYLRQCLPTTYEAAPHDTTAVAAPGEEEGEEREICMQTFCNKWNICLSDLAPDEPGLSTKVLPLADDEVPKFDCGICMETLDVLDLFHGMLCEHKFCTACMKAYVEGRIREGNLPIPCPDPACKGEDNGILHPERCKKAIDFAAFADWGVRLTERAVPANRRTYCPNRQCGVMLETSGEKKPAKALCPACKHLMCAACGMEYSSADGSGQHDCAKGPDAALVMKLAAERRWKRCPKCKMIVEKIDGCNTMSCRCRCVFCYRCGRPLTRPQAEEVGGQPCRCDHRGLAFAFAHHPFFLGAGEGHDGEADDDDDLLLIGGPAQQEDEI